MTFGDKVFYNTLLVLSIFGLGTALVLVSAYPKWQYIIIFFTMIAIVLLTVAIRPRGDRLREVVGSWWRRADSI